MLKKYEVLLIADEVVCAFGRLGAWFGCDLYGIKPDLVSLAKALSSAYLPIGAILISEEIANEVTEGRGKGRGGEGREGGGREGGVGWRCGMGG